MRTSARPATSTTCGSASPTSRPPRPSTTSSRPMAASSAPATSLTARALRGRRRLVLTVAGTPTEHFDTAFPATENAAVDAFHRAAMEAGYRDKGAPRRAPPLPPGLLRRLRPGPRRQQHRAGQPQPLGGSCGRRAPGRRARTRALPRPHGGRTDVRPRRGLAVSDAWVTGQPAGCPQTPGSHRRQMRLASSPLAVTDATGARAGARGRRSRARRARPAAARAPPGARRAGGAPRARRGVRCRRIARRSAGSGSRATRPSASRRLTIRTPPEWLRPSTRRSASIDAPSAGCSAVRRQCSTAPGRPLRACGHRRRALGAQEIGGARAHAGAWVTWWTGPPHPAPSAIASRVATAGRGRPGPRPAWPRRCDRDSAGDRWRPAHAVADGRDASGQAVQRRAQARHDRRAQAEVVEAAARAAVALVGTRAAVGADAHRVERGGEAAVALVVDELGGVAGDSLTMGRRGRLRGLPAPGQHRNEGDRERDCRPQELRCIYLPASRLGILCGCR